MNQPTENPSSLQASSEWFVSKLAYLKIRSLLQKMSEYLWTYGPQIICVPQLQSED